MLVSYNELQTEFFRLSNEIGNSAGFCFWGKNGDLRIVIGDLFGDEVVNDSADAVSGGGDALCLAKAGL